MRTRGFVYFGEPNVTLLSPTTGPELGGPPAVMLAGMGLHRFGGLHGGSHYRCRFGSDTYTTATVSASIDEAYCVAPAGNPAVHVPVAISLNGQQFHDSPNNYDRLGSAAATHLAEASPISGPIRGGTTLTVSGSNLAPTPSLSCVFDEAGSSVATLLSPTSVLCVTPDSPRGPRTAELSISIEAEELSASSLPFTFYQQHAPPGVRAVDPIYVAAGGGTSCTDVAYKALFQAKTHESPQTAQDIRLVRTHFGGHYIVSIMKRAEAFAQCQDV
mgnify:CR=1 FL=1